jgi:hypothetical protein
MTARRGHHDSTPAQPRVDARRRVAGDVQHTRRATCRPTRRGGRSGAPTSTLTRAREAQVVGRSALHDVHLHGARTGRMLRVRGRAGCALSDDAGVARELSGRPAVGPTSPTGSDRESRGGPAAERQEAGAVCQDPSGARAVDAGDGAEAEAGWDGCDSGQHRVEDCVKMFRPSARTGTLAAAPARRRAALAQLLDALCTE